MKLEMRIKAFVSLGNLLNHYLEKKKSIAGGMNEDFNNKLEAAIKMAGDHNSWFTRENISYTLMAIAKNLSQESLIHWVGNYDPAEFEPPEPKTIGLVMAGNIPLVGFFDFFYLLMSGNKMQTKLSSQDKHLLPLLADTLMELEPGFKDSIVFTDSQIKDIDAIIATGSDNSSRYFEYYFGKYPNIIRKNRSSIAVLTGEESEKELKLLGNDIFLYFGFGCRNVSKLYVPVNYDLTNIFHAIADRKEILNHNKYCNNYEYNKAIYLLNLVPHHDNGFLLLKEDRSLHSPIATLYYEFYSDAEKLRSHLKENKEKLQCVVSNYFNIDNAVRMGYSQLPGLEDYADGIDVMKFLASIR
jgi:hypothetical protein